jgi:hypothetical protein
MHYRIKSNANGMFITNRGKEGIVVTTKIQDDSQFWMPIALVDNGKANSIVIVSKVGVGKDDLAIDADNNYGPVILFPVFSSLRGTSIWNVLGTSIESAFYEDSSYSLTLADSNGSYPDGAAVQISPTMPYQISQSWEWITVDF